jgi:hypothetical protein
LNPLPLGIEPSDLITRPLACFSYCLFCPHDLPIKYKTIFVLKSKVIVGY